VLVADRARLIPRGRGLAVVGAVRALPGRAFPVERLVEPAWDVARRRRLTICDACYAVLAETLDAVLVTADRRLAKATSNAILVAA